MGVQDEIFTVLEHFCNFNIGKIFTVLEHFCIFNIHVYYEIAFFLRSGIYVLLIVYIILRHPTEV